MSPVHHTFRCDQCENTLPHMEWVWCEHVGCFAWIHRECVAQHDEAHLLEKLGR